VKAASPSLEWASFGEIRALTDERLRAECGVRVAFTARIGGVSAYPYASLNLALHVGDEPSRVLRNRRRLCDSLGLSYPRLTCAEQVHGVRVTAVGEQEAGCGRESDETSLRGCDAMVTSMAGTPLVMFFADCVPIVLVDPSTRVAGVVHAGWKGVLGGVVEASVTSIQHDYACDPKQIFAYIGPSIGPCCYRVDSERADLFRAQFGEENVSRDGRLDLAGLAKTTLDRLGLQTQNIAAAALCTADNNDDFFSYRAAGGRTGRHSAVVCIE